MDPAARALRCSRARRKLVILPRQERCSDRSVPPLGKTADLNAYLPCRGNKRSRPQDVTSSVARHGGANLQQEVEPQQTEKPPRDSSFRGYPSHLGRSTTNIQADGGRDAGFSKCPGSRRGGGITVVRFNSYE